MHCLSTVDTNPVQKAESLSETNSASHMEYFYVNQDRAHSAAEPPQNTTKSQKPMILTHMQNLATANNFHNDFSGPCGAQPKLHYTLEKRHNKGQQERIGATLGL